MIRVLCSLILAAIPGFLFPAYPSGRPAPNLRSLELQVYRKVNQTRQAARVRGLIWNERLATEARKHAGNMAGQHFFAHKDPARGDLSRRFDTSGVRWSRCAENLYKGNGIRKPADSAVRAWTRSPGHRRNMLDSRLKETGVGAALQRDGTLFIVQEFLTR